MTTVYLKITGEKKNSRIESREAWDVEKFLAAVKKQYKEDKENPSKVEVSSREAYLEQIKRK